MSKKFQDPTSLHLQKLLGEAVSEELSCQDNSVGREDVSPKGESLGATSDPELQTSSCAGSSPAPGNITISGATYAIASPVSITHPDLEPYAKQRGFLVYDEMQAIEALIYFTKLKDSSGFGVSKDGYRVEIRKVEG